jgi:PAS domain S-box-containing protein
MGTAKREAKIRRSVEVPNPPAKDELRAIIDNAPVFLWSDLPDGYCDFLNQRWLNYFNLSLQEAQGAGWATVLHPDDAAHHLESWQKSVSAGIPFETEARFRRHDGEYRWFLTRADPLRDKTGRIVKWYGTNIDIENLKRTEGRLRQSEAYLAEAQRLSHTGTWVLNATTMQYLYWSDESYRIWGFDPLEGIPSREAVWQRIHDRDRVWEKVQEALHQKKDYSGEFKIVLPNGTVKYLAATSHHLFSTNGLVEVIGTHVDVTERRRAEEALRESEAHSRSAIDGIAGLVAVMAPNGEVETVNRQCLDYFGRSQEWLTNWGTNEAVHPEDLPRILELFKRAMASGVPFNFELRLRRFDGEYRWFDNRGVPIRDDSGRIVRWYILLTDIEDRTQALAELEQMQSNFAHMNRVSMMGEWAAELSHEISQPIGAARNNARAAMRFLDRSPSDPVKVREALACVVDDTDRAGDIIDRIRDHIKKAPPRKEHFDLNEAIDEVIVLGQNAIIKNGVWVQTRLAEGLFPVHGDRVQLQQVVLNLLLNAVEAMGSVEGAPRELLISTEQDHTGVLVAVRDSGPGLDPSHLERVFDAFYTTKSSGMGMGLSICRSIIDAHGGRLWAEANEPRGAIFQFTLPAVPVGP